MSLSQVFYVDAPDGLPAEAPRGSEGLLAYGEMVLRKVPRLTLSMAQFS